jgi:hypothetical protein
MTALVEVMLKEELKAEGRELDLCVKLLLYSAATAKTAITLRRRTKRSSRTGWS